MEYLPTEFATVADKEKFARHFKRFVEAGYPKDLFHKWFYQRLNMCFGHIAHYDINGFYFEHFATPDRINAWEQRIAYWKTYGDPRFTFSDVEKDLSEWMGKHLGLEIQPFERMIRLG